MAQKSDKKQLNYGLVDAEVVQRINAEAAKFTSDLMNDGYGRLNKKEFMADLTEIFGPTVRKWVLTGLSASESRREATREKVKERMIEDINGKLRELMVEINKIISEKIDRYLEDYYGPGPASS